ncbi:hypothetical protein [Aquimarina brevivitae]|uniref:Hemolysin III n=1 Tax=Aquimarina brevivitae TaxID=323412 RepID=A0A4Q7PFT9_9FLAO|nr:hypothetical protein [Aquimarina brevivitae]RZS99205.1 hemolysin III [Aquimarina brevivitae]
MKVIFLINDLVAPNDSGPIYKETDMGRLPVEPFNTFSNLFFLGIILYFSIKLYKELKDHTFIALCLPVMLISLVGGMTYHGTRSHQFWLYLDWVPIMLLCAAVVIYFITKLTPIWWKRLLAIGLILSISFAIRNLPFPKGLRISIGYVVTALTVLVPIVTYLVYTKGKNLKWVVAAFVIFGVAILFRSVDKITDLELFYMGTHWLWHLFGGLAVFCLMQYIYLDNLKRKPLDKN